MFYESYDIYSAEDGVWKSNSERNKDGILKTFEPILDNNSDTIGWLIVPNTSINYPVVQTTDNEYYTKHDFY